jgi:hypothetical protein
VLKTLNFILDGKKTFGKHGFYVLEMNYFLLLHHLWKFIFAVTDILFLTENFKKS